ncbi:MAG TPA: sporulation histidine kinase inhibitor Sda [Pseudogracilibacillus sp.]|nr:sporulation histidine kinase inhibitor Sda [Pseudogracilibacillus sp.]
MDILSNDELIEAYVTAIMLQLDEDFIQLLRDEMKRRRRACLKRNIAYSFHLALQKAIVK